MVTEDTAVLHSVFLIVNQSLTVEVEPQGLDIATEMERVNGQFLPHQTFLLVCGVYCNITISS